MFALLPYEEYLMLNTAVPYADALSASNEKSLLSEDGLRVSLPNAPGEYIDLVRLAQYCVDTNLIAMAADNDRDDVKAEYGNSFPVSMRAQALDNFEARHRGSLDPLIRSEFLSKASPYRNTMQATTAVVNALIETGMFISTKRKYDFYRPVNALDFNIDAAKSFLIGKPEVTNKIRPYFWYKRITD
jgi:hypothetical protein